ncbi:hypothetical protein [Sinanaerobacter chloroacetimidivorans]|uniref:Uncharacterized protein n=1 Tax=Sinanaerobacter chloroacetimidivorans TaxID=2818044 RepID=A0A8J7VY95_9FIRM|nr:hypothetical protein [Sinanaerobacter chloroacetimidivorans]MBR0596959.1 hypothetical protein [Sinanaerobacter chloroacetimidivorans]
MKKLEYFDLLSPEPIRLDGVGLIRSPTLRDISKLRYRYRQYSEYMRILQIDMDLYLSTLEQETREQWDQLGNLIGIYDILIQNQELRELLLQAFSFFICGAVEYLPDEKIFLVSEVTASSDSQTKGVIQSSNYDELRSMILQMNYLISDDSEPPSYASEKARKIGERIRKLKRQTSKHRYADRNMNLGNLISSLAAQHHSLNIHNIWDITVFQFYDQFYKQNYINTIDIRAMNYAYWGGEFSPSDWFRDLHDTD